MIAVTMSVILLVTYGRAMHHPWNWYLRPVFIMFLINHLWYRCYSALLALERQHGDEPTAMTTLLWQACWQLLVIQLFVVFAVTPFPALKG